MAQFPCNRCGRRYVGPSSRAYVAILGGSDRWDYKPRLCPTDVQELVEVFEECHGFIDPADVSPYQPQPCLVCARDVDGRLPQSVFMTLYAGRGERRDAFAPLCASCRPEAERMLTGLYPEAETTSA